MTENTKRKGLLLSLLCAQCLTFCNVDSGSVGTLTTPPTGGPRVLFRPAQVPWGMSYPNNLLTSLNRDSSTQRQINVPKKAMTKIGETVEEHLRTLSGFSVFAPIAIPFDQPLHLEELKRRHEGDDYNFSDDAVYLVNINVKSAHFGNIVPLDIGNGNFNYTQLTTQVIPPDVSPSEPNLLFPTRNEFGGGPSADVNFNGVLEVANFLKEQRPANGVDGLLTHYDRTHHTLLLRPILPLEESSEYMVVLTDRLIGTNGRSVDSPFEGVYHIEQHEAFERLRSAISKHPEYYGYRNANEVIAHIRHTFSFSTQTVRAPLLKLRDGVRGIGELSALLPASEQLETVRAVGLVSSKEADPSGWREQSNCALQSERNLILMNEASRKAMARLLAERYPMADRTRDRLQELFKNIAHVVPIRLKTSWLAGASPLSVEHLPTTQKQVHLAPSHFVTGLIAVPTKSVGAKIKAPLALYSHRENSDMLEGLLYAGELARQGVATLALTLPTHERTVRSIDEASERKLLTEACLAPLADHLGKGTTRSEGILRRSDPFTQRALIEQAVFEQLVALAIIDRFATSSERKDDLRSDWNGDGIADIGGAYFTWGTSVGAWTSTLVGAIAPKVSATAPIGVPGGITDVWSRNTDSPFSTTLYGLLTPAIVVGSANASNSQCSSKQRSIRWIGHRDGAPLDIELACANEEELQERDSIVVLNGRNKQLRCGRLQRGSNGVLQAWIPLPATVGDELKLAGWRSSGSTDVMLAYGSQCSVNAEAKLTYSLAAFKGSTATCKRQSGLCTVAGEQEYAQDSPLVALSSGLGLWRQSRELRQAMVDWQTLMDPIDPISWASAYFIKPEKKTPTALFMAQAVGQIDVPLSSSIAFARAAGVVPFLRNSHVAAREFADFITPTELLEQIGLPPNQLLIDYDVVEGIPRLERHKTGDSCIDNARTSDGCPSPRDAQQLNCSQNLFDADDLSDGASSYAQPKLSPPLRLGRIARSALLSDLSSIWAPRLSAVWSATAPIAAFLSIYVAPGHHEILQSADACKQWDPHAYLINSVAHFFESNGHDLYVFSRPKSHGCAASSLPKEPCIP